MSANHRQRSKPVNAAGVTHHHLSIAARRDFWGYTPRLVVEIRPITPEDSLHIGVEGHCGCDLSINAMARRSD